MSNHVAMLYSRSLSINRRRASAENVTVILSRTELQGLRCHQLERQLPVYHRYLVQRHRGGLEQNRSSNTMASSLGHSGLVRSRGTPGASLASLRNLGSFQLAADFARKKTMPCSCGWRLGFPQSGPLQGLLLSAIARWKSRFLNWQLHLSSRILYTCRASAQTLAIYCRRSHLAIRRPRKLHGGGDVRSSAGDHQGLSRVDEVFAGGKEGLQDPA